MDINAIQDQIIDEFSDYEDKMDKYQHLISYGMQLPAMDKKYRTEKYNISGCQSRLWIASERINGKIIFHAESDSQIVRGMVAVVLKVVNHQPPEKITNTDLYFLDAIGLSNHLSPVRANGLATIVKRVYELAGSYVEEDVNK